MGLVSMGASWLHWGLGLIAGPIFLQFLVRRHPRIDYRLAVAAGYLGSTCTWHAGLSGSAPLLMATPKNFMEAQAGLIPISATTFSAFNLIADGRRRRRDDRDAAAAVPARSRRADERGRDRRARLPDCRDPHVQLAAGRGARVSRSRALENGTR